MTVSVAIFVGVVISVGISALAWVVYMRRGSRSAAPQEVAPAVPEEVSQSKVIEAFLVQATEAIRGGAVVPEPASFDGIYGFAFQGVSVFVSSCRHTNNSVTYLALLDGASLAEGTVAQGVLRELWSVAEAAYDQSLESAKRTNLLRLEAKLLALPDSNDGNQS